MKRIAHVAILAILTLSPVAHADNADALFKKGKKLLDQKKYAEACDAFEKSDKADASIGTKLNIAKCYEDWGKVATALKWYRLAEGAARKAKDERTDKIKEHMDEVDAEVPRLTLRAGKDYDPTVVVMLDGAPTKLDVALEVDPGAHVVEYPTEGGEKKKKVVPVERGGESEVKLDLPKRKPGQVIPKVDPETGDPKEPAKPPVIVDDPGKTKRMIGYGLGGAGLVAIGVSSYLTLTARGDYRDALASHCMGSTTMCDPQGLTETRDARSRANIATIVFSAGLLAVAGGVFLYVTAPKATTRTGSEAKPAGEEEESAFYLAPSVSPDGGGLVFGGRWR